MRDCKITVQPFAFIDLTVCNIYKTVNEHATALIEGLIPEELEDKYIDMSLRGIKAIIQAHNDEGEEETLFYGMVHNLMIDIKNDVKRLRVELVSFSRLMDTKKHIRTFQSANMLYFDVLESLSTGYDNYGIIMTEHEKQSIGDIIVQYKETDWEFAKRLASHFNSVLVPTYHLEGVKYYLGLPPHRDVEISNTVQYSMHKAVGEYIDKTANKLDNLQEVDAIYYCVQSREIYELAQKVIFKGRPLYICQIESCLNGGELIHSYTLKSKAGFKTKRFYNDNIIGASLEGTIIGVKQDTVKVHVCVDKEQEQSTAKWFSYSTVYSSPDGTGWYCMPEEGDAVRLYFPNENEADGYIISASHLEVADGTSRTNPDEKSIRNKDNKEVLFTPSSLILRNNKGMSVEICDEDGIHIISDKMITIMSDEAVTIASMNADIQVAASEAIQIEQANTKALLQENVIMSGAQVVVQI